MADALVLASEDEYRQHFHQEYCRAPIAMQIGEESVLVYFKKDQFGHAFFESSQRNGVKDTTFSMARACRMPLIREALENSANERYQGWDRKSKRIDDTRCVCVVTAEDFVVVVRLGLTDRGDLRGWFVTCYYADSPSTITQIRQKPAWDKGAAEANLRAQRSRR